MKRNSVVLALGGMLGLMVLMPAYAENKTVTLSVPGMDCEACPITVSKALRKVDGVEKVAASLERKEAVVTFNDATPIRIGAMTMSELVHESVLTCPKCSFASAETMPTDACQFFYECKGCGAMLKPNPGDCCVFCSFGSVKCPPMQANRSCCS